VAVHLADDLAPSLQRRAPPRAGHRSAGVGHRNRDDAASRSAGAASGPPPDRAGHRAARARDPAAHPGPARRDRCPPAFRSRREAELRITKGRILDVGLRSARALGRGTEFEALREYTPDDEFRRIDWSATARSGKPIVRTYRSERNQTVLVLLDTGRLMAGVVAGVPRLDHAMDAAMALTTVATRLGDRAGLRRVLGRRATVPPRGDRQQLARVTQAMFASSPSSPSPPTTRCSAAPSPMQRRRSLLVLLTELSSEALPETLVPALPLLLRRHLVLVASCATPRSRRGGRRPPRTRTRRTAPPGR
jgi:uncharacterized protein (DUF58 family)